MVLVGRQGGNRPPHISSINNSRRYSLGTEDDHYTISVRDDDTSNDTSSFRLELPEMASSLAESIRRLAESLQITAEANNNAYSSSMFDLDDETIESSDESVSFFSDYTSDLSFSDSREDEYEFESEDSDFEPVYIIRR